MLWLKGRLPGGDYSIRSVCEFTNSSVQYLAICLAMLGTGFLSCSSAHAAITIQGQHTPSYDGSDPWILDTNLYLNTEGTSLLNITAGSEVSNLEGYLGYTYADNGSVSVSDSGSTWTNAGNMYVGYNGSGTLLVTDGGVVNNYSAYLGYGRDARPTSQGITTIRGASSQWNSTGNIRVGQIGTGRLYLEDHGVANVAQDTWVGSNLSETGLITFTNGTLNTGGLLTSPAHLLGTGQINTTGLVTDIDLIFDATHGLQQQFIINSLPDQNITINLDASGLANLGSMGAGFRGEGTLTIADGMAINSTRGYLGYSTGSSGTAAVTGIGSVWDISNDLHIGVSGLGALTIEEGGKVNATTVSVAPQSDLPGTNTLTVTGAGSALNTSGFLYVGKRGNGELTVQNGGAMTTLNASIGERHAIGEVTIKGDGSTWNIPDSIYLGVESAGDGTLRIQDNSEVSIGQSVMLATHHSASAEIELSGGVLDLNGGSIEVGDGAAKFTFTGGVLKDVGQIDFKNLFIQSGGQLSPGGSIGITQIIGSYQLSGGTVEIELGGNESEHDLLSVSQSMGISPQGTTLDLSLLGPISAGTYTIVETIDGQIYGEFDTITGLEEYAGLFDVEYTVNTISVTFNQDIPEPGSLAVCVAGLLYCVRKRIKPIVKVTH